MNANVFELNNENVRITYLSRGNAGQPFLTYQDPEMDRTFQGSRWLRPADLTRNTNAGRICPAFCILLRRRCVSLSRTKRAGAADAAAGYMSRQSGDLGWRDGAGGPHGNFGVGIGGIK
jgi:hypothetical protein